ncbi:MAG: hypothetical protein ABIL01_05130 [Pseudomonadota bacterium]
METPLSPELLRKMSAYWRAANHLSVGHIYLLANPLLMPAVSSLIPAFLSSHPRYRRLLYGWSLQRLFVQYSPMVADWERSTSIT